MQTRVYLSGGFALPLDKHKAWLKRTGCKYRCHSYAYVSEDGFYFHKNTSQRMEVELKEGVGVMMDSSAHSFHNFAKVGKTKKFNVNSIEEMRDTVVERYVKFIKKRGKEFDFYVNFDYVKNAPVVYQMQKQLEKTGMKPVPVFHGDNGFDWLKRYIDDGHKLIMLGVDITYIFGMKKQKKYYDACFNLLDKHNVQAHGLAVTGELMFAYPWYSVDSTSWSKSASYGKIVSLSPERGFVRYVHVSERPLKNRSSSLMFTDKGAIRHIKSVVEARGFDFDLMRTSEYERGSYNAYCFANIDLFTKKEPLSRWGSLL